MKYQVCLGHMVPRRRREHWNPMKMWECEDCIADEENANCPDYYPVNFYRFEVEDEQKEK